MHAKDSLPIGRIGIFSSHFSLKEDGSLNRIIYSDPVRDSYPTIPVEKVNDLYRAMNMFVSLLCQPENHVLFKLTPGK